jgi:prolyl-tRNA editing enzyme YbaK/EbsC (Cys-tRNA(Pro) deacylase)
MAGRETPATRAARKAGIAFSVHEYRHDPAAEAYVAGGISPLGRRRRLPTLLDDSAVAHARPAGGSRTPIGTSTRS